MPDKHNLLPRLASRENIFDYLDGHSVRTADGLAQRHLTGGVVKTLMLETVPGATRMPPLARVLSLSGMDVDWIDDEVGFLSSPQLASQPFGILEVMATRHAAVYTLLKSEVAARVLNPVVRTNPWLDRLWLSAPMFERLWERVEATSHPNRYTRLKFDHEAFFEVSDDDPDLGSDVDDEVEGVEEADLDVSPDDRRASSFTLVDRVSTIREKLPILQRAYRPLESLVQLRIPASGRGGHDFYFDGRVTNRSDSFYDHRSNVRDVVDLYRRTTEASEEALWIESGTGRDASFRGAALTIRFSERLADQTFERWLDSTFTRHGRFRLSGRVFRTGPTRAQIAAIDRHLWQTLQMEVSSTGITALVPAGTCGNTVHRLITNIQRFLDPGVQAWLGSASYDDVVGASFRGAA